MIEVLLQVIWLGSMFSACCFVEYFVQSFLVKHFFSAEEFVLE